MPAEHSTAIAAVVYPSPVGAEGRLITTAHGAVTFGRGGDCDIRFGHSPIADTGLARIAGVLLVAAARRIVVESSNELGHAPLQIRCEGQPPVEVGGGEVHAPPGLEFNVVVRGDHDWVLSVRCANLRRGYPAGPGPETNRLGVMLSSDEQRVLAAYCAPLRAGALEPATHSDVAETLHYSVSKVRNCLYGIWSKMVSAGVPVPDYADKRIAVTKAALAFPMPVDDA